jgi:hypothetical protein
LSGLASEVMPGRYVASRRLGVVTPGDAEGLSFLYVVEEETSGFSEGYCCLLVAHAVENFLMGCHLLLASFFSKATSILKVNSD